MAQICLNQFWLTVYLAYSADKIMFDVLYKNLEIFQSCNRAPVLNLGPIPT